MPEKRKKTVSIHLEKEIITCRLQYAYTMLLPALFKGIFIPAIFGALKIELDCRPLEILRKSIPAEFCVFRPL